MYWKIGEAHESTEGLTNEDIEKKPQRRFLLRYYNVWNVEQCELPPTNLDKLPKSEMYEHDPIEAAERIIAGMPNPPAIEHAGSKAFYSSITDRVTMPSRNLFASAEEYSATVLHEMSHATGSPKRLNRASITEAAAFGSPIYASEELVAEMSAAFLCAEAGISPVVIGNQAAYIAGWLKKFRDDRRLVIQAASQAQRAADYVLGKVLT